MKAKRAPYAWSSVWYAVIALGSGPRDRLCGGRRRDRPHAIPGEHPAKSGYAIELAGAQVDSPGQVDVGHVGHPSPGHRRHRSKVSRYRKERRNTMPTMKSGRFSGGVDRLMSRLRPPKVWLLVPVVAILLVAGTVTPVPSAQAAASSSGQASPASSPPYAATGYFYVTQKGSGGWTLVTPQGRALLRFGHRHGVARRLWNRPGHGRLSVLQHRGERLPEHCRLGDLHHRPAALVGLQLSRAILRRRRPRLADALRGPAVDGQWRRLVRTVIRQPCRRGCRRRKSRRWPTIPT